MNPLMETIKQSIIVGQPLIQIVSYEEKRVEGFLSRTAEQLLRSKAYSSWDINNGLQREGRPTPDTDDPVKALESVIRDPEPGFYVFRDLAPELRRSERLVRKLREAYKALKGRKKFIFLLSADNYFPESLKKEIDIFYFPLPGTEELESLFLKFLGTLERSGRQVNLNEAERKDFVIAAQGLTLDEAYKAYMKAFHGKPVITGEMVKAIHEEKKQLILKENVLEYYTQRHTMNDMGGLDNLKDWLGKRRRAFSEEAREFGLEKPRGILCMGVSGCGKSLAAKITASLWNLPLFRLDMNLVYSGMAGSPELVFARALQTMDSVAPAILWIDEIESGISDKQGDSSSSRILGYFLTWMQEHTSEIFIAATANRIDLLPAELLRRGRFDQIFFIDLPTRREREEIFTIHLKAKGNELSTFNIPQLAQITKGWSGSEIEQVIISAMYEAFNENRPLNEDDLLVIFGNSVPLATTMEEQIKKIRSWAHNRAVGASTDKEY